VRSYDPAFAYETALIIRDGIHRMFPDGDPLEGEDLIYYLSLYNENYPMPAMPDGVGTGVIAGLYRYLPHRGGRAGSDGLFSGTSWLAADPARRSSPRVRMGVELWSASYQHLRSQALEVNGGTGCAGAAPLVPWVTEQWPWRLARSWPCRTGCGQCRTRSALGAGALRLVGHRRRNVPTPGKRSAAIRDGCATWCWPF
jgi:hypothetical protein